MLWVPQKGRVRVEHNLGAVGTATPGTSVTTGGTSSTKGTPVEIFAATAFDVYWVTVCAALYFSGTTPAAGALDILIGAATEAVLIPNLLFGGAGNELVGPRRWHFPLYIPAGSRIAAQAAGLRTSAAFRVWVILYGGDGMPKFKVGSKVTTYGMGTVPNGTSITAGASGAEGSWTQITASTSEDHFALTPSFQYSSVGNLSTKNIYVDLGTGSATEEEVAQSYIFQSNSGDPFGGPHPSMPAFQDIPSGTRLAMRASNSGTNDGTFDGVIHAMS